MIWSVINWLVDWRPTRWLSCWLIGRLIDPWVVCCMCARACYRYCDPKCTMVLMPSTTCITTQFCVSHTPSQRLRGYERFARRQRWSPGLLYHRLHPADLAPGQSSGRAPFLGHRWLPRPSARYRNQRHVVRRGGQLLARTRAGALLPRHLVGELDLVRPSCSAV